MIDALKEEWIVNKVGGRFKLSSLIQKRMVAINSGARPLVDMKTKFPMEIVIEEILQNKIYLDSENVVRITGELPQRPLEFDLSSL
jgi:DNA-directed RNA polymerase subunit omega